MRQNDPADRALGHAERRPGADESVLFRHLVNTGEALPTVSGDEMVGFATIMMGFLHGGYTRCLVVKEAWNRPRSPVDRSWLTTSVSTRPWSRVSRSAGHEHHRQGLDTRLDRTAFGPPQPQDLDTSARF